MAHHFVKQLVKNKAKAAAKAVTKVEPKAVTVKPPKIPKEPVSPKQAELDAKQEVIDINLELARNGKPPRGPITAEKIKARDILVDNNQMPTREGLRNADFRGMSGDVQGGVKGQPLRMEGRADYKTAQTGLPADEINSKSPKNFTPHHRMGIQDNRAFFEGKTGPEAQSTRDSLAEGGLYPGNTGKNYEPLFDGKLSSKKIKSTGINSTDHFDVHDLTAKNRERMGIKINKKDRSLDTFNGTLIKDMPEDQQLALQLQLAWLDEAAVDQIQRARFKAFKKKFGHLPQAEQREIILNNPELFANLSTNV